MFAALILTRRNYENTHSIVNFSQSPLMRKSLFAVAVLIAIAVTGMFIWLSTDYNHNNDMTIPFALSVLFALTLSILTELQTKKILFATIIGVLILIIIKIIIDWQSDPTSHNLFPFEILIDLIVISATSLIGVAMGLIYRGLRRRKSNKNTHHRNSGSL